MSDLRYSKRAIQFITIDTEGKCKLTKEAEDILSNIDSNIAVICVAGIYRSGKSYLLNRLLGRQDGFEIGPTIISCTKGLWIWGEPIKLKNQDTKVIIMDTEGLASAFDDRNESIDMVIFCLSLLLSSLFIYNSMKIIDESAIENLALVLNFAKKIQGQFKEVGNYVSNFPSFLWVLRDFALELIDAQGNEISPKQYLENALKEENITNISMSSYNAGVIEEINQKNDIRKTLKLFFPERDCYTLVRPVDNESYLSKIDKLPTEQLRPIFLSQMNGLVNRVFQYVKPKQIQNSYMNGKMYVNLIKMYLKAINSKGLPDVKTSYAIVLDQQVQTTFNKAINYYKSEVNMLDYKKYFSLEKLLTKHNELKETAKEYFNEFSNLNIPISLCLSKLKEIDMKLEEEFKNCIDKWKTISTKQCGDLANQLINEYKNKPELNGVFACLDTVEDILKFVDDYKEISETKYEVMYPKIISFFINYLKKGVRDDKTRNEEEKSKLQHEKNLLQGLIDKTKQMMESNREQYEKQIKDLKDEQLENRIDLEAKIDEKTKMIYNLQNSNQNTVQELQNKITELNELIEIYKQSEKENNHKSKKKKSSKVEEGIIDSKLDSILERIDNMKSLLFKSEIEKVRNELLNEMEGKYDSIQEEFRSKLKTAKKNCEKSLMKLKNTKDAEIDKLKGIIKDLNDEIQDYRSQVDSQEYKISLYKEKIINYEKERKQQTDHAELLKVLATKLNNYVDILSRKNKSKYNEDDEEEEVEED